MHQLWHSIGDVLYTWHNMDHSQHAARFQLTPAHVSLSDSCVDLTSQRIPKTDVDVALHVRLQVPGPSATTPTHGLWAFAGSPIIGLFLLASRPERRSWNLQAGCQMLSWYPHMRKAASLISRLVRVSRPCRVSSISSASTLASWLYMPASCGSHIVETRGT